MTILVLDKVNFRENNTTKDKEGHFTIIKESIHQENMLLNICVPNNRASKYMKKNWPPIECHGEIDICTIIVKDFNIPLLITYRKSRQNQ